MLRGVNHDGGGIVGLLLIYLMLVLLLVAEGRLEVKEVAAVEAVFQRLPSIVLIASQQMIGL